MFLYFFFSLYRDHRDLHSFPTRRSSDLEEPDFCNLAFVALGGAPVGIGVSAFRLELANWAIPSPSAWKGLPSPPRSEEHTSELQSQSNLVCRLLLEKKKNIILPD